MEPQSSVERGKRREAVIGELKKLPCCSSKSRKFIKGISKREKLIVYYCVSRDVDNVRMKVLIISIS